jgi:hypothetical protein
VQITENKCQGNTIRLRLAMASVAQCATKSLDDQIMPGSMLEEFISREACLFRNVIPTLPDQKK